MTTKEADDTQTSSPGAMARGSVMASKLANAQLSQALSVRITRGAHLPGPWRSHPLHPGRRSGNLQRVGAEATTAWRRNSARSQAWTPRSAPWWPGPGPGGGLRPLRRLRSRSGCRRQCCQVGRSAPGTANTTGNHGEPVGRSRRHTGLPGASPSPSRLTAGSCAAQSSGTSRRRIPKRSTDRPAQASRDQQPVRPLGRLAIQEAQPTAFAAFAGRPGCARWGAPHSDGNSSPPASTHGVGHACPPEAMTYDLRPRLELHQRPVIALRHPDSRIVTIVRSHQVRSQRRPESCLACRQVPYIKGWRRQNFGLQRIDFNPVRRLPW